MAANSVFHRANHQHIHAIYHNCSACLAFPFISQSRSLKSVCTRRLSQSVSQPNDLKKIVPQSMGPSVRLLLTLYDLQPNVVTPTGPHQRLLKGDVLEYITRNKLEPKPTEAISQQHTEHIEPNIERSSAPTSAPLPTPRTTSEAIPTDTDNEYIDLELSAMRKAIAKRLSKITVPHMYASTNCSITKLNEIRRVLSEEGVKVSVNDFIVKACAIALQRMPSVNSVWRNGEVMQLSTVDVSVAVAIDSGLITPIVSEANVKSVAEISSNIRELSGKAKEGSLRPHEFQGGSFTVSNLGMFGIKEFTAIINPPQAAILSVGCAQASLNEGKIVTTMNISLACDCRVVDESTGAQFLTLIKNLLENPAELGL